MLLDRPLVAGEQVLLDRPDEPALQLVGARLGAGLDEEVDVDLEVAGADRRLDAVRRRPRPRRARARAPTRWRRRTAARAAPARARRASTRRTGSARERVRPEPLQLARRPRQRRPRRSVSASSTTPGAVPASPSERRAGRQRRLLASRPPRSRRSRGASARRRSREIASISLSQRRVDHELATRGGGEQLDRAVVVGRAEAARDEQQVGARERRPRAPRPAPRPVADDRDPPPARGRGGRARAARNGPLRSFRSPRTSSLPVTTIAARGREPRYPIEAVSTPRAVTISDPRLLAREPTPCGRSGERRCFRARRRRARAACR